MHELIANRFEVLGPLGSGGSGDVLRVRDRRDGSIRALKRLRIEDDEIADRFRGEFAELAALRHPNIVRVYEYGTLEGGGAWILMEAIDGRSADQAVRPGDGMGALRLALDTIGGIEALHAAGRFHGDIKPSNILVSRPRSVLIDFGFMGRENELPGGRRRGTPGFLAPEVLHGVSPYGRHSDAYALGATLYRVLSGRAAFPGADATAILAAQAGGGPSLHALESVGTPKALADLVVRLMAHEPDARIAAMEDLRDLARRRLSSTDGESARAVLATSGPLIGREAERAALRTALLTPGRALRIGLLAGPVGSGRTRLAQEITIDAELAGWTVAWRDAKAALSAPASELEDEGRGLLLVLDDVDEWPEHAFEAIRLDSRGTRRTAVLATARSPHLNGQPFLQWCMSTSEATAPRTFELGGLPESDSVRLVAHRLGGALPAGLAEALQRESSGFPGALTRIITRLVDFGVLTQGDSGWVLRPGQSVDVAVRDAASDNEAGLDEISEDARRVLVAIAGVRPGEDITPLMKWTGLTSDAIKVALEDLAWHGSVRRDHDELRIVPPSLERYVLEVLDGPGLEQVREGVIADLESTATAEANPRLLRVLGCHAWMLGRIARAIEFWKLAWEASKRGESDDAIELSRMVEEREFPLGEEPARLLSALAEHWRFRRPALSEILWRRAAATIPSNVATGFVAECAIERARALFMLARYADGLEALEAFFKHQDEKPQHPLQLGVALTERAWGRAMLGRADDARADWKEALRVLPQSAVTERAVACNRLASFCIQWGELERAGSLLDEALNVAVSEKNPALESRILANDAQLSAILGRYEEARSKHERAVSLSRAVTNAFWLPVQLTNLLTYQGQLGDWVAWKRTVEEATSLARSIGDMALLCGTLEARESVAIRRADMAGAMRALRSDRDWLRHSRRPDQVAHFNITRAIVAGLLGYEARARSLLAAAHDESITRRHALSLAQSSLALGDLMLRRNRDRLAKRWYRRTLKSGFRAQNMAVLAKLGLLRIAVREADAAAVASAAQELESDLEHAPPLETPAIRAELRAVRAVIDRDAETARREYRESIGALESRELILRAIETSWEAARSMASLGDQEANEAFLREAWRLARETRVEAWKSRIAMELVSRGASSQRAHDGDETPEVRSLLARIAELMNSLLDYPTLIQKSLELVARHLEAERGYILLIAADTGEIRTVGEFGAVTDESQESALSYSRSIVRRVAASGEALRVDDAATDPRLGSTQSVLDLAVRSVLCTPLRLREELIGTVYLESRSTAAQFTETDLDVIDAYGNLVAIAIDNSRKFEALRRSRERIIGTNLSLRNDVTTRYQPANIVGRSAEIERVLDEIELIANSKGTVLITGESGTGKELIAKTIHYNSPRRDQPFLSLNCAAMPTDLIEAELFGIESHAATGVSGRPGIFERADKGTLFLDEIGDMPTGLQAKLLRVLQEREFVRVGTTGRVIRVDVRLIAATNQDLPQMIHDGRFREDLFFRLHALPIHIAPLRERKADILPLAEHFLKRFCEENGRPTPTLSADFKAALHRHSWPGNVRELQHYVERAVVMSPGGTLRPTPPSSELRMIGAAAATPPASADLKSGQTLKDAIENFEARVIRRALESAAGNQRRAARALGLVEPTLRYKMSRLGINLPTNAKRKN